MSEVSDEPREDTSLDGFEEGFEADDEEVDVPTSAKGTVYEAQFAALQQAERASFGSCGSGWAARPSPPTTPKAPHGRPDVIEDLEGRAAEGRASGGALEPASPRPSVPYSDSELSQREERLAELGGSLMTDV
jgi:hypothetical protein